MGVLRHGSRERHCLSHAVLQRRQFLCRRRISEPIVYGNSTDDRGCSDVEEGADTYYTGQWVPNLVADIMGPTPTPCDPNLGPGYGLEGFTRRINNIAVAIGNALGTDNTTSPDSIVRRFEWTSEQHIAISFKWLSFPDDVFIAITFSLCDNYQAKE